MIYYVAPIVEGQTEERCLERLLHRVWREHLGRTERLQVLEAFRTKRSSLLHFEQDALKDAVSNAFLKLQKRTRRDPNAKGVLLILLDAEDDCPATLAPGLVNATLGVQSNADVACIL